MSLPLRTEQLPASTAEVSEYRLGPSRRLLLLAAAVAMLGVLGIARWLDPNQRGYGTHEQLGLPPCAFHVLTGVRCPSCGMTTSFAYVVRWQFGDAARANAGGFLLALATMVLIPWCLASAVIDRPVGIRTPERVALWGLCVIGGITVGGWILRFVFFGEQG